MLSLEKDVLKELNQYLIEFKEMTIKLIACIEKEEYDKLNSFFQERQVLIDKMDKLDYSVTEFRRLSNELQLIPLQQRLGIIITKCRIETRQELDKISASRTANKSYNTKYKVDPLFFNKMI